MLKYVNVSWPEATIKKGSRDGRMLRILLDQDFDHDILRGVVRRISGLDYLTSFSARVGRLSDIELLRWAAQKQRILLTHDLKTMPSIFEELYLQGAELEGIFIVPRGMSMARSIDDLSILIACSENDEWKNTVLILPF